MNAPTGSNPKILWSPGQQDIWTRMQTEQHPLAALTLANAKRVEDPAGLRYNSQGRWEYLAFLLTGDRAYGRAAVAQIKATTGGFDLSKNTDIWNSIREDSIEWTMLFDGLQPVLTDAEHAAFWKYLNDVAEHTVAGTRFYDSDQTTGSYLHLALMDAAFGTEYLAHSVGNLDTGKVHPVGELDAGAELSLRQVLRELVTKFAAGGQWPESSDYNLGTVQLLLMGWYAIKTILGRDLFPEIAAWIPLQQRFLMHALTPDLKQEHQWGDVQNVRDLAWYARLDLYAMLSAWGPDETVNEYFRGFVADAIAANGITLRPGGGLPLYARYLYAANPYAVVRSDWREFAGLRRTTRGTGHFYARTGWTPSDRSLMFRCSNWDHGLVDHMVDGNGGNIHGDLMLYRRGRFVKNHPLAYGPDPLLHNGPVIAREGGSTEAGGLTDLAVQHGQVVYGAGDNAGAPPFWAFVMPTYMHEIRVGFFWFTDGEEDLLLMFYRLHAQDPRKLTYSDGQTWEQVFLYPTNAAILNSMEAVKVLPSHMPMMPAIDASAQRVTWQDGPVQASLQYLTPPMRLVPYDEQTYSVGGNINPIERKWAVHAMPQVERDFDLVLSVETYSETPSTTRVEAVSLPGAEPMAGFRVGRPNKHDVLALVSAKPSPTLVSADDGTGHNKHDCAGRLATLRTARQLTQGFDFTLDAPTTLYVADLDPTLAWTLDGAPVLWLSDGLWTADLPAGSHAVRAAGVSTLPAPDPVPVPVPDPQPTEGDAFMADVKTLEQLVTDLNVATNHIASRINAQVQQIQTLQAQVTNGTPVSATQLDGIVASLTAERDRLQALGQDSADPIPVTTIGGVAPSA